MMVSRVSYVLAVLAVFALGSNAQAEWTQMADMPGSGRHHPATFTLNGLGYVVTGSSPGNTDDFFRYDPTTNQWTVLPDFPGPDRSYAYAGSYAGKGYLGFGSSGNAFRDLWEYDPVTEQWTELASCPGPGRNHPAFVITDNGKIFVGAGNSTINYKDWWEYDIATDVWTQKTDLPGPPRHHPYHFNIGDDAYVCFGHGAGIFRDVYRWNQDTDSWTTLSLFPGEARVAGTEFSYDGKGYALSGEGQDHQQFDDGEFWEYTPETDSWIQLESHPGSGRWAPGSFLIGDTIYMMGGLSTTRLENDMWSYPMNASTHVAEHSLDVPTRSLALHAHPNPFNPMTTITFLTDRAGGVRLNVFDAEGRTVRSLVEGYRDVGAHEVSWDGRGDAGQRLASGQYFYQLVIDGRVGATEKIVLLK